MRDVLFNYYVELGHELQYQNAYLLSATRIDNAYSAFLMLTSATGIVTLSCWDQVPLLWALIALVAQILQTLKPLMPFSRQKDALRFMRQDTQALFDDLALFWDTIGSCYETPAQNEQIKQKLYEIQMKQRMCIDRFAADIEFPNKKRLAKKAKQANEKYFWFHYGVTAEEVLK